MPLGVKQGEPLSPLLFILFVNNTDSQLSNNVHPIRSLYDISLFMIMYADDTILFVNSEAELQLLLNKLAKYGDK